MTEGSKGFGEWLSATGARALARRRVALRQLPRPLAERPEAELRINLEYVLARRMAESEDFYFVQIGAFDGRRYDPIYHWVRKFGWRGLLIEPQQAFFDELVRNYEGAEGLEFRRIAVGTKKERRTFYTVAPSPGVSRDAGMIASFDRETLLAHRRFIPNLDSLLRSEELECEALNDVLAGVPAEHVDLLQIDVEGFDYELIRVLDLSTFQPSVIRFEHQHLSPEQHDAAVGKLIDHGYQVCLEESDTLAYLAPPERDLDSLGED